MQYQPAENLVKTLGAPQAQQRLEAVLTRSMNPRIIDVDVTADFLRYRYPLSYIMGNP
jgi:hypothetical protein